MKIIPEPLSMSAVPTDTPRADDAAEQNGRSGSTTLEYGEPQTQAQGGQQHRLLELALAERGWFSWTPRNAAFWKKAKLAKGAASTRKPALHLLRSASALQTHGGEQRCSDTQVPSLNTQSGT